jgi:hypothetical protein
MATSPNEEIMSAISEHPPTQTAWSVSSDQALPSQQLSPSTRLSAGHDWHRDTMPRTESVKRRETETRIGVWVDGVVHWDDVSTDYRGSISANTGLTGVQTQAAMSVLNSRPNLRIAIPGSEHPSLSTIVNPRPRQQAISVAPASLASKIENAAPHITVDGTTEDISRPGDAEMYAAMYASIAQNIIPGLRPSDRRSTSSSTASSTVAPSDASEHSKRSSATSMDHVNTSNSLSDNDTTPPGIVDINKPLPPVPIPNTMRSAPAPPSIFVGDADPSNVQNTQNVPYSNKILPGSRVGICYRDSVSAIRVAFLTWTQLMPNSYARLLICQACQTRLGELRR